MDSKRLSTRQLFLNDLSKILLIQFIFQALLSLGIYLKNEVDLDLIQVINISLWFLVFLIILRTLKYAIANRYLTFLLALLFFSYSLFSMLYLVIPDQYYNFQAFIFRIQHPIIAFLFLLITLYLFFKLLNQKMSNNFNLSLAFLFGLIIITVLYYDISFFMDFETLYNENKELFWFLTNEAVIRAYYAYLINLSLLIFMWFTYNQGHYILSEYLGSAMSLFTLYVIIQIYNLWQLKNDWGVFINSQYFDALLLIGFAVVWLIRLYYLISPQSRENEKIVVNYDLLNSFVDYHKNTIWELVLKRLGKMKLSLVSFIIFLVTVIPLIFLTDINDFTRVNIIIILSFILIVIFYAIIYTQRKWYKHLGFLVQKPKKS